MSTQTQGPWTIDKSLKGEYLCESMNTDSYEIVFRCEDIKQADAKLIAAAPDLLAALEEMTEYMEEAHANEIERNHYGDTAPCSYCVNIAAAKAAIAKAKGE